jgi:hypothetical protein
MTDAAFTRPGLIAGESDTMKYEGAGIFEAALGARDAFAADNNLAGFGNVAVVGLSALGAVMDPFQAIFAAGVGWLMEHLDCLREPLDWLAGDPKEIEGQAKTWQNLQQRTYEATEFFVGQVRSTASQWGSEAATAYRAKASEMAESMLALGAVADSMSDATLKAGALVGIVRNTVRDLIAEVVGAALSKALQSLLVVTIPKVLAEVAILVAECTAKITRVLRQLMAGIKVLGGKFPALSSVCNLVNKAMDGPVTELEFGSLFLNSSKLHAADSYVSDSDGPLAAYKHAYRTLGEGNSVAYGTEAHVAVDALQNGFQMNTFQNGGAAGDGVAKGVKPPDIELPL